MHYYITFIQIGLIIFASPSFSWNGSQDWQPIDQETIARIANEMIDIRWQPKKDIRNYAYSNSYTYFSSSKIYTGMAYCQNNPQENLSEFLNGIHHTNGGKTYFGNDCSGFVSICWQLPERYVTRWFHRDMGDGYFYALGAKGKSAFVHLMKGDALNASGRHIRLFDKYVSSGVQLLEQTPDLARRKTFQFSSLISYQPIRRELLINSLTVGDMIETTSDDVKVRENACVSQNNCRIISYQEKNIEGIVIDGPKTNDTYRWWKIKFNNITGWVAEGYLRPKQIETQYSYKVYQNNDWHDISYANQLTGLKDDNYIGPIIIGFPFPFFNDCYEHLYISSNGFIGFGETNEFDNYRNTKLPMPSPPNNIIAWCWRDLLIRQGKVYYQYADDRFIIQFSNYGAYSGIGTITAQVTLFSNGQIRFQYYALDNHFEMDNASIGLENHAGSTGLQLDSKAITDGMAIDFYAQPIIADKKRLVLQTPQQLSQNKLFLATHIPESGNRIKNLKGRILDKNFHQYAVAVFVYRNGWFSKPYLNKPFSEIDSDGFWQCDITTQAHDEKSTRIKVLLFHENYQLTQKINGISSMPSDILSSSVDCLDIFR